MIINVLAQTTSFVNVFGIVVFLIYAALFILIIVGLIRLVRFLGSAGKEMKLMRMDVGKLAEEVHLLRQKLNGGKNKDSST